jgi:hypothetical protein
LSKKYSWSRTRCARFRRGKRDQRHGPVERGLNPRFAEPTAWSLSGLSLGTLRLCGRRCQPERRQSEDGENSLHPLLFFSPPGQAPGRPFRDDFIASSWDHRDPGTRRSIRFLVSYVSAQQFVAQILLQVSCARERLAVAVRAAIPSLSLWDGGAGASRRVSHLEVKRRM